MCAQYPTDEPTWDHFTFEEFAQLSY